MAELRSALRCGTPAIHQGSCIIPWWPPRVATSPVWSTPTSGWPALGPATTTRRCRLFTSPAPATTSFDDSLSLSHDGNRLGQEEQSWCSVVCCGVWFWRSRQPDDRLRRSSLSGPGPVDDHGGAGQRSGEPRPAAPLRRRPGFLGDPAVPLVRDDVHPLKADRRAGGRAPPALVRAPGRGIPDCTPV